MSTERKSLKDRAQEMSAPQLPLMVDKTKGETEDLIGVIVNINDFGFLSGDNGEYAVFTVTEEPGEFFFGGKVLTDALKQFQDDGYLEEIQKDGLPMVLAKKKTKDGKKIYINPVFYPEATK